MAGVAPRHGLECSGPNAIRRELPGVCESIPLTSCLDLALFRFGIVLDLHWIWRVVSSRHCYDFGKDLTVAKV